jgi:hypothetical protein
MHECVVDKHKKDPRKCLGASDRYSYSSSSFELSSFLDFSFRRFFLGFVSWFVSRFSAGTYSLLRVHPATRASWAGVLLLLLSFSLTSFNNFFRGITEPMETNYWERAGDLRLPRYRLRCLFLLVLFLVDDDLGRRPSGPIVVTFGCGKMSHSILPPRLIGLLIGDSIGKVVGKKQETWLVVVGFQKVQETIETISRMRWVGNDDIMR